MSTLAHARPASQSGSARTTPGFGEYANSTAAQLQKFVEHFYEVAHAQVHFYNHLSSLANRWEFDTAFLSSVNEMTAHPAYRAIVDFGEAAIPFLLDRLSGDEPELWGLALEQIAGVCPVPPEHAGQLDNTVSAWLAWGHANGYWG